MLTEFAYTALNCLAQIVSFEACFHLQLQTRRGPSTADLLALNQLNRLLHSHNLIQDQTSVEAFAALLFNFARSCPAAEQ